MLMTHTTYIRGCVTYIPHTLFGKKKEKLRQPRVYEHSSRARKVRQARLKAAWPGVSRKVSEVCDSGMATSNAPMCCVMPPASPAATAVLRSASSSDVCAPGQPVATVRQGRLDVLGYSGSASSSSLSSTGQPVLITHTQCEFLIQTPAYIQPRLDCGQAQRDVATQKRGGPLPCRGPRGP